MHGMNDDVLHAIIELFVTAATTFVLLWMLQPLATRFGLLDRPAGRKDHSAPTPSTGGIAMLAGTLIISTVFGEWTPHNHYFMVGATLLVLIGVLDDLHDLRWYYRIVTQCASVWVMTIGGTAVHHIGPIIGVEATGMGALSTPFTIFATVGLINAINMTDGVDGLAGGVVLATLCMLDVAAIYSGNFTLIIWLSIFAGAVMGFLMLNMRFPWQQRARVFMGNAGSALLGLVVAWASFRLTQNYRHPVTPILAPWLVSTPLIDCVSLMAHRIALGKSPFRADHDHMHHLMLDAGFSASQLTIATVVANLVMGLLASVALLMGVPQPVLVLAFVALCIGYFWLTLRRERAVAFFAKLHGLMMLPSLKDSDELLSEPITRED